MTPAIVVAAFALIFATGWALLRPSERTTTGATPRGGDHVLLDHLPVGALLLDPALRITWAGEFRRTSMVMLQEARPEGPPRRGDRTDARGAS